MIFLTAVYNSFWGFPQYTFIKRRGAQGLVSLRSTPFFLLYQSVCFYRTLNNYS